VTQDPAEYQRHQKHLQHIPKWPLATAGERWNEVLPKRLWIEGQAGGDENPESYKVDKEIQTRQCEVDHQEQGEDNGWWLDQASQLPEQVHVD